MSPQAKITLFLFFMDMKGIEILTFCNRTSGATADTVTTGAAAAAIEVCNAMYEWVMIGKSRRTLGVGKTNWVVR